jgi:Protein of unknown function (DUF3179)
MRTLLWLLLLVVVAGVLAVVGAPVWLVQPFAPQTPDGLSWSWTLRKAAPTVTLVGLVLTLVPAALLWRRSGQRRWGVIRRRSLVAALVLPVAAAAWFSRQNHFEWMFRPFPDPRFVDAAKATDLKPAEPVIAVAERGESLAFPITRIGYHHLVNTALGGVPIVATY